MLLGQLGKFEYWLHVDLDGIVASSSNLLRAITVPWCARQENILVLRRYTNEGFGSSFGETKRRKWRERATGRYESRERSDRSSTLCIFKEKKVEGDGLLYFRVTH